MLGYNFDSVKLEAIDRFVQNLSFLQLFKLMICEVENLCFITFQIDNLRTKSVKLKLIYCIEMAKSEKLNRFEYNRNIRMTNKKVFKIHSKTKIYSYFNSEQCKRQL